jgi:hypothetical protein
MRPFEDGCGLGGSFFFSPSIVFTLQSSVLAETGQVPLRYLPEMDEQTINFVSNSLSRSFSAKPNVVARKINSSARETESLSTLGNEY